MARAVEKIIGQKSIRVLGRSGKDRGMMKTTKTDVGISQGYKKGQLVPYEEVSPGFETIYTGERAPSSSKTDEYFKYSADGEGNAFMRYSQWGFAHAREEDWNDEIRHINSMQRALGPLDDDTRKIRDQVASLVCCDSGVPVTIDEALNAIGTGRLPEPSFHPGCWMISIYMRPNTSLMNLKDTERISRERPGERTRILTGHWRSFRGGSCLFLTRK